MAYGSEPGSSRKSGGIAPVGIVSGITALAATLPGS